MKKRKADTLFTRHPSRKGSTSSLTKARMNTNTSGSEVPLRRGCLNIESLVLGKNHKKTKDTERTIDVLKASPGLSKKFVLNKEDELKKRPRFNNFSKSAR